MSRKKNQQETGRHQHPLPGEISERQKDLNSRAREAAEKDMHDDAALVARSPNDDLDEEEAARQGDELPL